MPTTAAPTRTERAALRGARARLAERAAHGDPDPENAAQAAAEDATNARDWARDPDATPTDRRRYRRWAAEWTTEAAVLWAVSRGADLL